MRWRWPIRWSCTVWPDESFARHVIGCRRRKAQRPHRAAAAAAAATAFDLPTGCAERLPIARLPEGATDVVSAGTTAAAEKSAVVMLLTAASGSRWSKLTLSQEMRFVDSALNDVASTIR